MMASWKLPLGVLLGALVLAPVASAGAAPRRESSDAKARSYFTDTTLLTQDGRKVRFYSDVLKDRVVVINFIFTNCPDACPLLTRKLVEVKEHLKHSFGRDVQFISISVDAERDTPEALLQFARKNHAAIPGWTFLTGRDEDVEAVIKRLGQYVKNPADHSTAFIIGNVRTRHWTKVRPDATPSAIAEQLRQLVSEK